MAIWARVRDDQQFTEEELYDAVAEEVTYDDLEEAMKSFDFMFIWNRMGDEARELIMDEAITMVRMERFYEVDEEDE
jgi:hypothetical protein